jgi:hypothetical protein
MSTTIYIVHTTNNIVLGVYPTFESAEDAIGSFWDGPLDNYLVIAKKEMGKELMFGSAYDEKSRPEEGWWVYTRVYKTIRL